MPLASDAVDAADTEAEGVFETVMAMPSRDALAMTEIETVPTPLTSGESDQPTTVRVALSTLGRIVVMGETEPLEDALDDGDCVSETLALDDCMGEAV